MIGADRQNSVNIDPGPDSDVGANGPGPSGKLGAFVHWQQPAIEGPGPVLPCVGELTSG